MIKFLCVMCGFLFNVICVLSGSQMFVSVGIYSLSVISSVNGIRIISNNSVRMVLYLFSMGS